MSDTLKIGVHVTNGLWNVSINFLIHQLEQWWSNNVWSVSQLSTYLHIAKSQKHWLQRFLLFLTIFKGIFQGLNSLSDPVVTQGTSYTQTTWPKGNMGGTIRVFYRASQFVHALWTSPKIRVSLWISSIQCSSKFLNAFVFEGWVPISRLMNRSVPRVDQLIFEIEAQP